MTTPAAPVLSFEGSTVTVSFDAPKGSNSALLYVSPVNGAKRFYDAENECLLRVGQTGKVIPLTGNVKSVKVNNLAGDVEYTATIAFRGADDLNFGPTSPASAPLTIVSPVAPQAPLLEAVSRSKIKVTFVAPPHCVNINMIFHDGKSEHAVKPDLTLGLKEAGAPCLDSQQSKRTSIVVKGLSDQLTYKVALEAYKGCWGPRGPWSKPLKLADHVPEPPCAPFLDKITQDSVRVSFSLMPKCSHATIRFKQGATTLAVDDATNAATIGCVTGDATPASKGEDGVIVSSLLPDTAYEVSLSASYRNSNGWSAASPSTKFRTLPAEVEITGTKTQEERDAELRKNAVDVDAADPPPKAKRAKKK